MIQQERGFGLISLAVVIAITGMIAAGAGMTTVQIIKGTDRNESHAEVVRQAHNLGRWFTQDALAAENITADDNPETGDNELMTINWKEWVSGNTSDIRYIWLDDVDSLKQIKRTQVLRDKDGAVVKITTSLVANSIYSANLSQQDDTWVLSVETRSEQKSSEQEYKITKRLNH